MCKGVLLASDERGRANFTRQTVDRTSAQDHRRRVNISVPTSPTSTAREHISGRTVTAARVPAMTSLRGVRGVDFGDLDSTLLSQSVDLGTEH